MKDELSEVVEKSISETFGLHGLTLRYRAKQFLCKFLVGASRQNFNDVKLLNDIIDNIQNQQLDSADIDESVVKTAIRECTHKKDNSPDVFTVIGAFDTPRFLYVEDKRKFISSADLGMARSPMFGTPFDKAQFYRNRYMLVKQRLLRHRMFSPVIIEGFTQNSNKATLETVESLLGASGRKTGIISFGMITQLKEDKFYLEDPTGSIALNLTEAVFKIPGLYTESSLVLIEGDVEDKMVDVKAVCQPPAEEARRTRTQFDGINMFGGPSCTPVANSTHLARAEQDNADAMFVFISDVWLDVEEVVEKLRTLFEGYAQSDVQPFCFVLCGHFTSQPYGKDQFGVLQEGFKKLAALLSNYPTLVKMSRFVFVPGLFDPTLTGVLPRPPLPATLTQPLLTKCPTGQFHFTTNPCRIQYCTKEIVVLREDMVHKLCRNTLHMPSDKKDVPVHFAHSLICQSHLAPLPLHVAPVHWSLDYTLGLYPLPDLVVVADRFDPYKYSESGCTVMNPGCFQHSNFAFKAYVPASHKIEDCLVP